MQRLLLFIWWKKEISGGEGGVHWTDDEIGSFLLFLRTFFIFQIGGVYL